MMGEILNRSGIEVCWEVNMPDGGRIVVANPPYGWVGQSVDSKNRNVFRVDRDGNIVWQVQRDDGPFINWEVRNKHAKEDDPHSQGFVDFFRDLSDRFFEERPLPYTEYFNPASETIFFDDYAPGRLLWIATDRWVYQLDPETGIATYTGHPVR